MKPSLHMGRTLPSCLQYASHSPCGETAARSLQSKTGDGVEREKIKEQGKRRRKSVVLVWRINGILYVREFLDCTIELERAEQG